MANAVYSFTGDPITYGHIDIIERAATIFEHVNVAFGINATKTPLFTLEERMDMAKHSLSHLDNISIDSYEGMLTDYAYKNGIKVIVKGLRGTVDYNYEALLHFISESQRLGIETLPLFSKKEYVHISSSNAKGVAIAQGKVHEYVPLYIKERIEGRLCNQYFLGVTGEIGVGKSYVAGRIQKIMQDNNIETYDIDLDKIAHEILNTRTDPLAKSVRTEIIDNFGVEVKDTDGFISRKILGDIVFDDYEKLKGLNDIMLEPILHGMRENLIQKKGLILINSALIAELDLGYICNNNVLLVKADKNIQKERLRKRDATDHQIKRRINSQYSFERKYDQLNQSVERNNNGQVYVLENNNSPFDRSLENISNEIIKYLRIR